MDDPDKQAKRDSVDQVCAEFDQRKGLLEESCGRVKNLIEDCLRDAKLRYQSVQARVKSREKLRTKYLNPDKDYTKLDDITDLAALRVITYYEDQLDPVVDVIKREFAVIPEKSVDKRKTDPDRFGYRAVNLVCTHSQTRKSDVQFKNHWGFVFEIQVTSVLGHAWSEIEHEWYDLRETYPDRIKRRFSRLAALLEIAESEFVSLRDQRISYVRSVGVRVEAGVPDISVDAVSLQTFCREPLVARLDAAVCEVLERPLVQAADTVFKGRATVANAVGLTTVRKLRDSMRKHETAIPEFVRRAIPIWAEEHRRGIPVSPGISIYQLAMMLAGVQGEDALRQLFEAAGLVPAKFESKFAPLTAIARELLAKYSSGPGEGETSST